MSVLLLVLPDFLLIGLGWVLYHRLGFSAKFFQDTERLVYFVLFPALLFHATARAPLSPSGAMVLFEATAALLACGVGLAWLAVPILRPDPIDHASTAQCAYRFNTYIGLSMAAALAAGPGQATMAVVAGFAVPFVNMAAVHALARQQHGRMLGEIVRNPFIIATVAGLTFNFLAIPIPALLYTVLGRLGESAIVMGLLCVGAVLSLSGGARDAGLVTWMIAVRLILSPIAALVIGWAMHLPLLERQMLLLFSALPASSSAHVLANRMGGNGRLTAMVMSLGTLLSAATIPFWLAVGPR
ncbi:MAG: AEC family transporter [Candidimonas sp.]|nr:MAG: AEC family transporter [Candidimonas sp.]